MRSESQGGSFAPTRWTVVLTAGRDSWTQARGALEELCRTYWYPLYAYVRRRGHSTADAEDLTQGFFARLLELQSLGDVRRDKGKFRSFLLASFNHYLADQRDRDFAQKRDVRRTLSLDVQTAETRYDREPVDDTTPDRLFERQWALTLLEVVVQRLRREYEATGKEMLFMHLRFAITGEKSAVPYAELSARLGLSEEAVRVAVHRLRQRYRQVLREEIAETVADAAEVEEELQYLRRNLAG